MFELVRDYIMKICLTTSIKGKVILCGGIQINMGNLCEDFFETLLFEVYENGEKILDLLQNYENGIEYVETPGKTEDEE